MHLIIAKVNEVLFEGGAHSLTAPGGAGEMTVLAGHEPLITTLKKGDLRVHLAPGDEPKIFAVDGGVLEVSPRGATVIL